MSREFKTIAIVDLNRHSKVHFTQLIAAAVWRQPEQTYCCLEEALSYYADQGWVVHVFQWVVGIRGMMICCTLSLYYFPGHPTQARQGGG